MRLIDADTLMQEFAEFVRHSNNSDYADIPTWNDAVSLVGSAPTIDPVKNKLQRALDGKTEEETYDFLSWLMFDYAKKYTDSRSAVIKWLREDGIEPVRWIPSAQTELLTDKEQRIFLAAIAREEKICEEVDRNYVREPYEDSLMRVCKEIRRKVKGALWT